METGKRGALLDFMRGLKSTPMMEIFKIMRKGEFNDARLPEIKKAGAIVYKMNSFQKAAQTFLLKIEMECRDIESSVFSMDVPKIGSDDFEIFVQKLERLEKLQDDMSYVWDFLWTDIEKRVKKSREGLTVCAGFNVVLVNERKESLSPEYRLERVIESLGLITIPKDEENKKRREKMN